ncbi:hypothetical protein [Erysipelatoclostridium sp. AM42-17]|uniref:hypothetical protein n=1 Tax=Erysipelatoclostridium sp. AM42-17 TaxID=2293102 RepID=UPI000E4A7FCD|nr:hypothetical protein [Erysipelatoclostridium sp. AM42-17]RHS95712.1 hypothetical protein DW911_03040 [Erysipelatoclostridium sp. AM42-17]
MKYKDMRMTMIAFILNIIILFMMIYFLTIHQIFKFCIAGLLFMMTLSMALMKFKCYVFDDSVIVYSFKGIGVFPQVVKYDNVQSYELISKHKLIINLNNHKRVKLCIFDAHSYYLDLDQQYHQFLNKKNNTSNK